MSYAELHCISNFTFLRGASHPAELVQRAKATRVCGARADRRVLARRQSSAPMPPRARRVCRSSSAASSRSTDGLRFVALATSRRGYAAPRAARSRGAAARRQKGTTSSVACRPRRRTRGMPRAVAAGSEPAAERGGVAARALRGPSLGRGGTAVGRGRDRERLERLTALARELGAARGRGGRRAHAPAPPPRAAGHC